MPILVYLSNLDMGGGAAVVIPPSSEAGGPVRRRSERFVLDIEGKSYVFHSIEDVLDYLESQKVELEKKAEKKAVRQAKRILSTGKVVTPKHYRVQLPEAVISAQPRIAEILRDIEQAYSDALQAVFAREAEDDEDLAVIASFL